MLKTALSHHLADKAHEPLLQGDESKGEEGDASATPSTPPAARGILAQRSLFITDTGATTGVSSYFCVRRRNAERYRKGHNNDAKTLFSSYDIKPSSAMRVRDQADVFFVGSFPVCNKKQTKQMCILRTQFLQLRNFLRSFSRYQVSAYWQFHRNLL